MNNITAIARREFSAHFGSPTAYISISIFLALLGLTFFLKIPFLIPKPAFFEARDASLRYLFEWMVFLFTIILPAISMRLLAEEKKLGTIEILMTMPVTDMDVVLGKLLGASGFLLTALFVTLLYPLLLVILGSPDPGPIIGGYVGVLLVGMAYLAIGLLASSLTTSQITAFITAIGICAAFTFVDRLPSAVGFHSVAALDVLSFSYHFRSIARGVIDSRDIIFFVSVLFVSIWLTSYSLESRKWKKGA